MNTMNINPGIVGGSGHHLPETPRVTPADLTKPAVWRPALIGLAILSVGIGLILLKAAVQSGSQDPPLQLPLPMPAGTLMAESVPTPHAIKVSPGSGSL